MIGARPMRALSWLTNDTTQLRTAAGARLSVFSRSSTRGRSPEDGVTVSDDAQCEIVRSLFVATREQVQALAATLELDGLE